MSSGWRQLIVQMKRLKEESMSSPNQPGSLLASKVKVKEEMEIVGLAIMATFLDQ